MLEKYIRRMMEEALQLTVDKLFNTEFVKKEESEENEKKFSYSVEGYTNTEPLWKRLFTVKNVILIISL